MDPIAAADRTALFDRCHPLRAAPLHDIQGRVARPLTCGESWEIRK